MIKFFTLLFLNIVCLFSVAQVNVATQHHDQFRTGWNKNETILNKTNVSTTTFGKLFTRTVDDETYAQPLIISNVQIAGGVHNILLVATVNNSVYAFDADSSAAVFNTPYWQVNLTPAGSRVVKHNDLTGACGGAYHDFDGNIGIVGTPVVDTNSQTIFLVSRNITTSDGAFHQYFHAIDIRSGNEKTNSPVEITASVNGNGGGSVSGVIHFDAERQNQRPGLLLLNGIVYISYASHCDWNPYHGWMLGYDENTLQQKIVYCTTPQGIEGGIWQSGSAPSADSLGNIYVGTGNGTVGLNGDATNISNRGESLLRLTPSGSTLNVTSYFTPTNWQQLLQTDLDYGTTQSMLLPNTNLVLSASKDGNIYLTYRDNMGGFNSSSNNVVQDITLCSTCHLRSSFSYYKGTSKEFAYSWSENALLRALPFNRSTNQFDLGSTVTSGITGPSGNSGAFLSVSSNGSDDNTAILWASHSVNCDANQLSCPGVLRAIDATDITHELWNSNNNPSDGLGNFAKFNNPSIANGKVYMGTFSKQVVVYGVTSSNPCNYPNVALAKPVTASSIVNSNYPASNAVDGKPTTRWTSAASSPQWIYVDLQGRYDICNVIIKWESDYAVNYLLQVSDDASTWTTVKTLTNNSTLNNTIPVNAAGRYVRIYATQSATQYGYSIYEFQVFGTPDQTQCPIPSGLNNSNISGNSATVSWTSTGANSYNVQYKAASATTWNMVNTAATSLTLNGLSCGTDYLFQVQGVCTSATGTFSATGGFTTSACIAGCGYLPTRWNTLDIGMANIAGSACFNVDTFALTSSGADIGGNADAFRFAYVDINNNVTLISHVTSLSNTDPLSKGGVMIREDLSTGSRNAYIALTPQSGAIFQTRNAANGATTASTMTGINAPYWIKLVKTGSVYSGFVSPDSITWTQVGSNVDLQFGVSVPVYMGMALSSYNTSASASMNAIFTSVSSIPVTVNAGGNHSITPPSINLAGTTIAGTGGPVVSTMWTEQSGPNTATFSNANALSTQVNGLTTGQYIFRLTAIDSSGGTAYDSSIVTVNPVVSNGTINVRLYAGSNPFMNTQWNNWNVGLAASPNITSGAFKNSDGSTSSISAVLSYQNYLSDNGVGYTNGATMCPDSVLRYCSYSTSNRTLTISGLSNTNAYNLTFYASRYRTDGQITKFTIGSQTISVNTDKNSSTAAQFLNITPANGQIVITISRGVTYNYLNGFTISPVATNAPPSVNAGINQSIVLPNNSVTLSGSANKGTGGPIVTTLWNEISGPNNASINNPNAYSTSISGLVQGTYVFKLSVTDSANQTGTATLQITVLGSLPPVVGVGTNQTIAAPASTATLYGTASAGSGGPIVSILWNQQSGPNASTISNNASLSTGVSNLIQGIYVYQLTVTDSAGQTNMANTQITITAPTPPTVNAGANQTIYLPSSTASLTGSANNGSSGPIVSTTWSELNGPNTATIVSTSSLSTGISNLIQGVYTFQLSATDSSGNTSTATTQITVNATPPTSVNVRLYSGINPFMNTQWNNWNVGLSAKGNISSGLFNYSDGSPSGISGSLSYQDYLTDNGAKYSSGAVMCPDTVLRYTSYSTAIRTLTLNGLSNASTYNFEFYASRGRTDGQKTIFTINGQSVAILTDNNTSNTAKFNGITPSNGQVIITLTRGTTYNYLNGFKITQNPPGMQIVSSKRFNAPAEAASLNIEIRPNPTLSYTKVLITSSNSRSQISLKIFDLFGHLIENRSGINEGSEVEIGNNFPSGTYIIQVTQVDKMIYQKMIKL